jgi:hypothetical protein
LKKTVTILFTALYLLTTSGILVGQHMCMGRVKESALFKQVEKQCMGMPEMHMNMKDCCHDEWSLEKIEDSQQMAFSDDLPQANYFLLFETALTSVIELSINQEFEIETRNTGPPDIPATEFYIKYHSLKIPSALQS